MPLLDVKGLKTHFFTDAGIVKAVDGVDFTIEPGKTLGVVGESGCGKSVTAYSIMGLIQSPPGKVVGGEILYDLDGNVVDLAKLDPVGSRMRSIRGNKIAMIFQEPMTALNPVYTIGNQLAETIILHQKLSRKDARNKAIEMLASVRISLPEQRIKEYPHQLSGGMRQRVMIAMALSCSPALLIADEPTTALDVTVQAQVLELMNQLKSEYRAAILFITHDLGVIAGMADNVIVMYLGRIIEGASIRHIFHDPRHPYTQGLLNSIPSITAAPGKRHVPIDGVVPDFLDMPQGCGFEPRCPRRREICRMQIPSLTEVAPGHRVACWRESR